MLAESTYQGKSGYRNYNGMKNLTYPGGKVSAFMQTEIFFHQIPLVLSL